MSIPYIYYNREEAEKGGNFKLEEKLKEEWQKQGKPNRKKINPTSSYPLIFIQAGENLGLGACVLAFVATTPEQVEIIRSELLERRKEVVKSLPSLDDDTSGLVFEYLAM